MSGYGYLATTLAAIDVTLAGLFWSWGSDEDILARLGATMLAVGAGLRWRAGC